MKTGFGIIAGVQLVAMCVCGYLAWEMIQLLRDILVGTSP